MNQNDFDITIQEADTAQGGFGLLEVIVSIVLLSIITLGLTSAAISALKFGQFTELNQIASSLAISKMEELASQSAVDLNAGTTTEDLVPWPDTKFTFKRVTSVVVNSDQSRTVHTKVSSNDGPFSTSSDFTTTFAVWE